MISISPFSRNCDVSLNQGDYKNGTTPIIFEFLTILLSSRIHISQGMFYEEKRCSNKRLQGFRERIYHIHKLEWTRQHLQCLIIHPHYFRVWVNIQGSPGIAEALHIGHQFFCLSHSWMQHTWYWCSHCILPITSPSLYSSWNMKSVSVRNAGCRKQ